MTNNEQKTLEQFTNKYKTYNNKNCEIVKVLEYIMNRITLSSESSVNLSSVGKNTFWFSKDTKRILTADRIANCTFNSEYFIKLKKKVEENLKTLHPFQPHLLNLLQKFTYMQQMTLHITEKATRH